MKPLPAAKLTKEDWRIWLPISLRGRVGGCIWPMSMNADRRDAELMFSYERAKANLISRDGLQRYIDTRAMVNSIMSERVEPAE